MKPSDTKLKFFTADLAKVQKFYSVLGVVWLGGEPEAIGSSGLPVSVERCPSPSDLPHLWGTLGNLEIVFYLNDVKSLFQRFKETAIMVYYDGDEEIPRIVAELIAVHLFAREKEFDKRIGGTIYDPDGRRIEIWGPHPFRL